jgi:hypothetical protein
MVKIDIEYFVSPDAEVFGVKLTRGSSDPTVDACMLDVLQRIDRAQPGFTESLKASSTSYEVVPSQ